MFACLFFCKGLKKVAFDQMPPTRQVVVVVIIRRSSNTAENSKRDFLHLLLPTSGRHLAVSGAFLELELEFRNSDLDTWPGKTVRDYPVGRPVFALISFMSIYIYIYL